MLTARGQLGLGTPLGIAGISGELNVARFLAFELGVGHNAVSAQVAALAHGRLPLSSTTALVLGLGISRGAYEHRTNWIDGDHSDDTRWNGALFGNAQLAIEILTPPGFSLRAAFGAGRLLNPASPSRCTDGGDPIPCAPTRGRSHTVPFLGVAAGWAFTL